MDWISNPEIWTALLTLTLLEVVLGVDNVVFISILASKLPEKQQDRARQVGIVAAGAMRVLLLMFVGWIVQLEGDLFELFGHAFTGKDLIVIVGGVFLLYKAISEIHDKLEGEEGHASASVAPTFKAVILQVMILDIVFSLDSVITAVGMTTYVPVMVAAVLISVSIMFFASKPIYAFVNDHPTVKMLALSFLMLIGVTLVAEGFGNEIPKGYIYAAIAFSVLVEGLNLSAKRARERAEPVHLHEPYVEQTGGSNV